MIKIPPSGVSISPDARTSTNQATEEEMTRQPKQLNELFHDGLKDIYFAEKKILSALPKLAKAAQTEELASAFEKHEAQTEAHVGRLEEIFQLIEQKPQGKNCPAIMGLVEEGQEIMKDYKNSPALDAGLLGAAQSVEHYEIARYGTLIAWAKELDMDEAAGLLGQTLTEEVETDALLSRLAEKVINREAQTA
jgi:ferritin-like metal-binding protein YciE